MIFLLAYCKGFYNLIFSSISSIREDKTDRSRSNEFPFVINDCLACVTTSSVISVRRVLELLSPPQREAGLLSRVRGTVVEVRAVFVPQKCSTHQYPPLTREFKGFSFQTRDWIALYDGVCYLCFCTSHT